MNHSMSRRRFAVGGASLACSAVVPTAPRVAFAAGPSAMQDAVQSVAQSAVKTGDIPGVVTQVWHKGELRAEAAAGWLDVESRVPMRSDAIFGLASMTKPVTVALALKLADEGKLRLDDPITRWAPEFATMRVLRAGPTARSTTRFPPHGRSPWKI